ncbi:MAG: hypothetical protein HGA45_10280 [Chloroflexales bacterium]|nr:hypothetical protein [Chloroflexales bacterium]
MAPLNPEAASHQADLESTLRARITDLESQIQRQAEKLDSTYALLGQARAERERAEAALNTANQLIEGFFEHAPLGLQIYDREGYSFRMNEVNRRILGVPTRDYGVGQFNALTDPAMIAHGYATLFSRAYAGEIVRVSSGPINLAGPPFSAEQARQASQFEQALFPIIDEDGEVTAVVACIVERSKSTAPGVEPGDSGKQAP